MEALRLPLSARRASLSAALLLACGLTGCQTVSSCKTCDGPPRSGDARQLVAAWSNKVHYVPDVVHGGTMMPGIAGRVYLFGPQVDVPLSGEGTFVAQLYDDSGPTPVPMEQWNIDKETAKKLLSKDFVGWGYTMFLPWGTYRPDATKVHLTLRYEPEKGEPLFIAGGPLTLEHTNPNSKPPAVQQASAKVPATK